MYFGAADVYHRVTRFQNISTVRFLIFHIVYYSETLPTENNNN